MALASTCGLNNALVYDHAFACVTEKIKAEPIAHEPFPHIYISEVFPSEYYEAILNRIATVGKFVPALYPGVAVDLKAENFRDHGLTCQNLDEDEELSHLYKFLKSERFSRVLLDKFSASNSWGMRGSAIPDDKHVYFANGRSDFTTVFDLHKDLPGYEISPHPDIPSKIVTFLFYLTRDDRLREFGTLLCTPTPRAKLEGALGAPHSRGYSLLERTVNSVMRSPYGFGQRDGWFPWDMFRIAKVAEALPNSLLVFAPNSDSYHAVRMNIPAEHPVQERLTLRGFIRSGANSQNYIAEYSHRFSRKLMFGIARVARSFTHSH